MPIRRRSIYSLHNKFSNVPIGYDRDVVSSDYNLAVTFAVSLR